MGVEKLIQFIFIFVSNINNFFYYKFFLNIFKKKIKKKCQKTEYQKLNHPQK